MNFSFPAYRSIPTVLLGSAIAAPLLWPSSPALGLTGAQVNRMAEQVTVFIRGVRNMDNFGSGVLVARQGNTYRVLTAGHVIDAQDRYTVTTADNLQHLVTHLRKLPNIDLAEVTFESSETYALAQIGDAASLTPTEKVYVTGFPKPGFNIPIPTYTITDGNITTILNRGMRDGYGVAYTNPTRAGMSGGPVFNEAGQLIAIHGRKEGEADGSMTAGAWLNLGIPINLYQTSPMGGGAIGQQTPPLVKPVIAVSSPRQQPLSLQPLPVEVNTTQLPQIANEPLVKQHCQLPGDQSCRTVVQVPNIGQPGNEAVLNPVTALSAESWINKGNQAFQAGEQSQAIAYYSKALELDPDQGIALFNRAVAYHHTQQSPQAMADFRAALAVFQRRNQLSRVAQVESILRQLDQP
ncbi:tetratricopeptide repeat-containing S1 family peptidase [Lyngbya confervoides]|uniref:Trypsin-like peptidase domain-containing protein n=1 Tax=Lyngbya confervoides BDU141951 TaxID=1574623 RepID=A0ABD4T3Y7_9CYAN|nr:trypsin-like peptidase domain-containing protein [Lyngbya confervoides]MCM1983294.1 trypsin-like peptidase domain-containing protein [Lyngbya confervoides BDU141951]